MQNSLLSLLTLTPKGETWLQMITSEYLKELFTYSDGKLYYKKPRRKIKVGNLAGNLDRYGYLRTCIDGKDYRVHRLIWLYLYGELPVYIDHINGDRMDNRPENLRVCTKQENTFNKVSNVGSTSKYKGVDLYRGKWRSRYSLNNKQHHIGLYDTEVEAAKAYDQVTKPIHKSFHKENNYE